MTREPARPSRGIDIRPLETIEQMHEAADVLREVWGGDRDAHAART